MLPDEPDKPALQAPQTPLGMGRRAVGSFPLPPPARVFERMQLLEALAAVLPAYGDADPGEFLDELMIHTGLLRQKSRSSYDFVHLTFFKAVRGIDGREYPCERPISARSALLGLPQRLRLEKKTD